jgi:opacity protein-like surface antigen
LREQYVYGARVLPGYQATDSTSFYGIVGVARGHFVTTGSVDADVASDSSSNHFNLNGYQLGLGTKTDVYKNIAVRTDLIYTGYQTKTFESNTGSTSKIEPSTIEANVAAVYKFG